MDPPFRLVETAYATYLVMPIKTHRGRCFFCTEGARHGHCRGQHRGRGRRFRGRRGPRSFPPRRASPATSSNRSSTPPYTAGLVSRSPSPVAQRLPTPTPPEEPPRRRLVVRIRRPATQVEGVGIFPDLNIPAYATETATHNAGFGPQAGPAAISSFTAATSTPGLAGLMTAAHPSFMAGTMAAHRGAPPFFSDDGGPPSASSTPATEEAAAASPSPFGRVGAVDRRPGIRHGTWSPATLGLPSFNP
jgi:hypothetical protein